MQWETPLSPFPLHLPPPSLHLMKVCKTLCQKINSRQNILIYSTIFDRRRRRRRRHFLGLLPRIIYACFNFICCLTNATPIRQSKICYFDTFKVAPLCKNTPTTSSAFSCSVAPQKMKEQIALKASEQESICQQIVLHLCARILTDFQRGWVAIESVERASINQSVLHSFARELCVWRGGSLKQRLIYCSTLTVCGEVLDSH